MKISKIVLRNFESHEYSEIPLDPGITVITGQTDSGKSSIYRAVYWLVANEPRGDDFIRRGESTATVELHLDDGTIIVRRKGKGVNQYEIIRPQAEPLVYNSIGNSIPQEVWALLGMDGFLLPGEEKPSINFAEQGSPPFGVYDSGPEKARKLSSFTGLDRADAAIRLLTSEIKECQKSIQIKQREKQVRIEDIKRLANVETQWELLEKVKVNLECARAEEESIQFLKKTLDSLVGIKKEAIALKGKIEQIRSLEQQSPDLRAFGSVIVLLSDLRSALHKLNQCQAEISEKEKELTRLSDVHIKFRFQEAEHLFYALAELRQLQSKINEYQDAIQKVEKYIKQLEEEEAKLKNAYVEELKKAGVCPLCGQVIPDNILEPCTC